MGSWYGADMVLKSLHFLMWSIFFHRQLVFYLLIKRQKKKRNANDWFCAIILALPKSSLNVRCCFSFLLIGIQYCYQKYMLKDKVCKTETRNIIICSIYSREMMHIFCSIVQLLYLVFTVHKCNLLLFVIFPLKCIRIDAE